MSANHKEPNISVLLHIMDKQPRYSLRQTENLDIKAQWENIQEAINKETPWEIDSEFHWLQLDSWTMFPVLFLCFLIK